MAKAADTMSFDFNKWLADLNVPMPAMFDVETLMASQRKTMDTFTAANKLAYEGMQALMQRQSELLRQMMDEASTATQQLTNGSSATEKAARQAELTKLAYERGVANMREMGDMMFKTNSQTADLFNQRFAQMMDEMRDMALKVGKKA